MACELPAALEVPLSRLHVPDIRAEVITRGIVASISESTIWRRLAEDAVRPWTFRSWIFPRDPEFERKAARVLDLYAREFERVPLRKDEYVISADEKTSIQARCRCHPSLPAGASRAMRIEHEYRRGGALQYLAAWDCHRARIFGRCEPKTGIAPFDRLVARSWQPSPTHRPGACSGWWTTAPPTAARPPSTDWRTATPAAGTSACGSSTRPCTPPGSTRSRSTYPSSIGRCSPPTTSSTSTRWSAACSPSNGATRPRPGPSSGGSPARTSGTRSRAPATRYRSHVGRSLDGNADNGWKTRR